MVLSRPLGWKSDTWSCPSFMKWVTRLEAAPNAFKRIVWRWIFQCVFWLGSVFPGVVKVRAKRCNWVLHHSISNSDLHESWFACLSLCSCSLNISVVEKCRAWSSILLRVSIAETVILRIVIKTLHHGGTRFDVLSRASSMDFMCCCDIGDGKPKIVATLHELLVFVNLACASPPILTKFPLGSSLAMSKPGPPHPLHTRARGRSRATYFAVYQRAGGYSIVVALLHGRQGLHSSKLDCENIEIEGVATDKEEVKHELSQFVEWPFQVWVTEVPCNQQLLRGKQP